MFKLFAGLATYTVTNMFVRTYQSKQKLYQNNCASDTVKVVYENHILCPYLKTYIVEIDNEWVQNKYNKFHTDNIVTVNTVNCSSSENSTQTLMSDVNNIEHKIKHTINEYISKEIDTELEINIMLAINNKAHEGVKLVSKSNTLVFPAITPGGYRIYTFEKNSENKYEFAKLNGVYNGNPKFAYNTSTVKTTTYTTESD